MTEYEATVALATRILDRPPSADPDDDLAMLSRQFLRAVEALDQARGENARLRESLRDMVQQFAHWSDGAGGYWTGGLSALEGAFEVLGWSDPCPAPDARCDAPDCLRQATCGRATPSGYRIVCGEHYRALAGTPTPGAEEGKRDG